LRVLVDTHALIWAADDRSKLSVKAISALQDSDNELFVSAASVWELSIKQGRTWKVNTLLTLSHLDRKGHGGFEGRHAEFQAGLPLHHGDPFDRMIVAQALIERFPSSVKTKA